MSEVTDLKEAVASSEIHPLICAVAALTGELGLLRAEYRPNQRRLLHSDAGLSAEAVASARADVVSALAHHRVTAASPVVTNRADARVLVEFLVGPDALDDWDEFLFEELSPEPFDPRAPSWHVDTVAARARPFRVAVIGAGMSGLATAHRLLQAGLEITVFEKNSEVGGTWYENSYPGCRVDVPSHFYSYSFAQTSRWTQRFSGQRELLDYFRDCADDLDLRRHIQFETEVEGAIWHDDDQQWQLTTRSGDGIVVDHFDALVCAVGQLNRPVIPDLPGRDDFKGSAFHSARWDHNAQIADRRVAVIGTGASGLQVIPSIAGQASRVTVFQRTPAWLLPTPSYLMPLTRQERSLLEYIPNLASWDRLWQFWQIHEATLPATRVDPDWPHQDRSVSASNEKLRVSLTRYLQEQFADPNLLARVLPTYPPFAKRTVRDDGTWAKTLRRPNVELVTSAIERITPEGVRTVDAHHDVDVVVYATGFAASSFLAPMQVVGVDGRELHEHWKGDARAYLGITVPGFPNFFMLYGPNTNLVVNGSIIVFAECQARYVVESLGQLLESGRRSMDCRQSVYAAYNDEIDQANRNMAWGASTVNSWYKTSNGRVSQNWPHSLLDYWRATRHPNLSDFILR